MLPDPAAPSGVPLKNRRGWLIAFGVLELVIACFSLLLAALVVVALLALPRMNRPGGPPGFSIAGAFLGALVYVVLAAVFLSLGVGSIKLKNWARLGTQVVSGFWLATGVLTSLFFVFIVPRVIEQQGRFPVEKVHAMLVILDLCMTGIMVVLPATLLAFYSLPSVRATCSGVALAAPATAAATPQAVYPPVPVMLLALWECFGVLAVLSLLMARGSVVFGVAVHGPAAIVLMTTHAALSGIAAWLIYRRDYLGWTISLAKGLFWAISWIVTALSRDLFEVYREMGFSEAQLHSLRLLPHFQVMAFALVFAGFAVYLFLIFYTKKYFSRFGPAPA